MHPPRSSAVTTQIQVWQTAVFPGSVPFGACPWGGLAATRPQHLRAAASRRDLCRAAARGLDLMAKPSTDSHENGSCSQGCDLVHVTVSTVVNRRAKAEHG